MIACTPINKVIRDKLENKKKILGREIREAGSTVSDINEDGTFLKTTFIRMTSNLENQITLMGGELRETVWPLLDSHKIRVHIDSVYPLEKFKDAHTRMENGNHLGKIILSLD